MPDPPTPGPDLRLHSVMTQIAHLEDRALLHIAGAEATHFLQNLITCDVERLEPGQATFGALLTPQGKVLFDFFVLRGEAGFTLETADTHRSELAKRLAFYKLRADVTIEPADGTVHALWGGSGPGFADPRLAALGNRAYGQVLTATDDVSAYHAHRVRLGVPHSGADFALGDAFPHEASMDQFGGDGIDFTKGCYVGQEVVSRMQHRGTARSRFVGLSAQSDLPVAGTEITAGDRTIGKMGSSHGTRGLALVRLDRAKTARNDAVQVQAGAVAVTMNLPDYVSYGWPQ